MPELRREMTPELARAMANDPYFPTNFSQQDYDTITRLIAQAEPYYGDGAVPGDDPLRHTRLTAEEQEVVDRYLALEEKWKNTGLPQPQFDPDKPYNGEPLPVPVPEMPKFVVEDGDGHGVVVNTEAMRRFAQYLRELADLIQHELLDHIPEVVKPGVFGAGGALAKSIDGTTDGAKPGLKPSHVAFLKNAVETFIDVADDIERICKEYDSAEELNNVTAAELESRFNESFSRISNFTGPSVASK